MENIMKCPVLQFLRETHYYTVHFMRGVFYENLNNKTTIQITVF